MAGRFDKINDTSIDIQDKIVKIQTLLYKKIQNLQYKILPCGRTTSLVPFLA